MRRPFKRVLSAIVASVAAAATLCVSASADVISDKLAKRFLDGATAFQNRIDITDLCKSQGWGLDDLPEAVLDAYLCEPELFFVSNHVSFLYTGSKYYITPQYTATGSAYTEMKEKLDAAAKEVVKGITDDMTEVEKALYVHDYLILNCKYFYGKNEGYDAYDCLVSQSAVCQGYTLAYEYILTKYLGMECTTVCSDKMNHAWNYVKIGKNWYHVDVTRDDAASVYKTTHYDNYGVVDHSNFLLSDSAIRKTKNPHYDWRVLGSCPAATDTSFDNAFWRDCGSQIVCDGTTAYYVIGEQESNTKKYAVICSYDFKTGKNKRLAKIATKWYAHRNESGTETYADGKCIYSKIWMSLVKRGSKLYFNTNKCVYSFDLSTKKANKIYTLDKGTDQIFGLVQTTPNKIRLAYKSDLTYPENYLSLKFV